MNATTQPSSLKHATIFTNDLVTWIQCIDQMMNIIKYVVLGRDTKT
jgi:hypothetical protein